MSDAVVFIATEKEAKHAKMISDEIHRSARVRNTGIATRSPEYIIQVITERRAVVAVDRDLDCIAGFSYIETWGHQRYVSNSGLIVFPDYRGQGLGGKIKKRIFELSRNCYPNAKLFGLTTSPAVMHINNKLGYHPVNYAQLTDDQMFWEGCKNCVNYKILLQKNHKNCLCTSMIFDPSRISDKDDIRKKKHHLRLSWKPGYRLLRKIFKS